MHLNENDLILLSQIRAGDNTNDTRLVLADARPHLGDEEMTLRAGICSHSPLCTNPIERKGVRQGYCKSCVELRRLLSKLHREDECECRDEHTAEIEAQRARDRHRRRTAHVRELLKRTGMPDLR